jgi:hypothetical protein
MFQDLDATLAALVESELAVTNVAVSFAAPDDQFPPSSVGLPALSFFLYDVRENHDLRTNQWELERRLDGVVTRQRPPVRVDCSYLITAWPSESAPDPSGDEHRLLGELLKVLLRHRVIPREHLRGDLEGHEPPLRGRVLAENQLQSLGELWQAMGGKPKAILHYGVTLSVEVFEPEEVGPEVTERVIELGLAADLRDPRVPRVGPAPDPTDPGAGAERATFVDRTGQALPVDRTATSDEVDETGRARPTDRADPE